MAKKRSRSAGVRNPVQRTLVFGLGTLAGVALILCGLAPMRQHGVDSSPLVLLGLFPALLCPIFFVYYLGRIRVFRDLRSGRTAIARWTVPAAQFRDFREAEDRIPASSVLVNFYRLPRTEPAEGVEVIFSDSGVLIGGGYFPLSPKRGRRLQSVQYHAAYPPTLEFGTLLETKVRTSSNTIATRRAAESLRVPVAMDARGQVDGVVERFEASLRQSR